MRGVRGQRIPRRRKILARSEDLDGLAAQCLALCRRELGESLLPDLADSDLDPVLEHDRNLDLLPPPLDPMRDHQDGVVLPRVRAVLPLMRYVFNRFRPQRSDGDQLSSLDEIHVRRVEKHLCSGRTGEEESGGEQETGRAGHGGSLLS